MLDENKTKRFSLYTIGAFLFSAFITAIYNLIVALFEDSLSNIAINISNIVFSSFFSYIDTIHSDIGKGIGQYSSNLYILFYILIFFVLIGAFAVFLVKQEFKIPKEEVLKGGILEMTVKPSNNNLWIFLVLILSIIIFVIALTYDYAKNSYNNRAITYIERTLVILNAYVPDEIPLLKAKYRAIDSACSYQKFEYLLKKTQRTVLPKIEADGIKLPSFQSFTDLSKDCKK